MDQFNKEIAQTLLAQGNLKEVFRTQLEKTVNSLLQAELTAILGYDPYDRSGPNTTSSRKFKGGFSYSIGENSQQPASS
ncbi:hypothetical protein [Loigolactobacillus backii]|uniref:hypothetical protein n=1 Tax=Loigolactobacillus backii TaxID=375175 RepID=UPI001F4DAE22|nr:hypothetical protein [Loigolactobacillus backii]